IAVLNSQGIITQVNSAWRKFALDNGDEFLAHSGPGVNYLEVCKDFHQPPDDATAVTAQRGVREVLEGRCPHFSMEYPCHSPTEQRWFVMHVSPVAGEQPGAVVSHVNITEWRSSLQELQV
ncbi:MAG: PAS domain-containing protein, partial [Rhodoferax sp.]|nr:PAS domain-containing protein [Rhodoferax sp.]